MKSGQDLLAEKLVYLVGFFSKCCHSKTNKDIDMKPKLDGLKVEDKILHFHNLKKAH